MWPSHTVLAVHAEGMCNMRCCIPGQILLRRVKLVLWVDRQRTQEVIRGQGEAVQPQEYTSMGLVTEFGVATELHNHVQPGMLQYLRTLGPAWNLLPSDSALVFVDNHDRQRGSPGAAGFVQRYLGASCIVWSRARHS